MKYPERNERAMPDNGENSNEELQELIRERIEYDLGQGVPENDTKAVGLHLRSLTITGRI
jgi:hypothetical protein